MTKPALPGLSPTCFLFWEPLRATPSRRLRPPAMAPPDRSRLGWLMPELAGTGIVAFPVGRFGFRNLFMQ